MDIQLRDMRHTILLCVFRAAIVDVRLDNGQTFVTPSQVNILHSNTLYNMADNLRQCGVKLFKF